jgi:hypothetical protein
MPSCLNPLKILTVMMPLSHALFKIIYAPVVV